MYLCRKTRRKAEPVGFYAYKQSQMADKADTILACMVSALEEFKDVHNTTCTRCM